METVEIFNYVGFGVGVLGIILSVYLYFLAKEKKDPRYFYESKRVIVRLNNNAEDSRIRIFYGKKEVNQVSTATVWIWNHGRKPIHRNDVPAQSDLKILLHNNSEGEDCRILDHKVVRVTRPEVNFSVASINEKSLAIGFDFLDHNDGAIVEIQHTGDANIQLGIEGVILGAPDGFQYKDPDIDPFLEVLAKFNDPRANEPKTRRFFKRVVSAILALCVIFGPIVFLVYSAILVSNSSVSPTSWIALASYGLFFFLILSLVIFLGRGRMRRLPKALR